MKVWTVGTWVACLMISGCGDKDSDDTGASTAAEADADTDTDTDTDTDADTDAEYGGTLTLEDGTEVLMQDSIAYNDVENELALAIMHTSWAGATCNVDQVFDQADGTWYVALVYPEKPTKAQIYSGFNGQSETSARHIGQVDVDTTMTDEGSGEGTQLEGEVRFGTSGNQGAFDFKALHCGETSHMYSDELD